MNKKKKAIGLIIGIIVIIGGFLTYFYYFYGDSEEYTPNSFTIKGEEVNDFAYVLQFEDFSSRSNTISTISTSKFDLMILEGYFTTDSAWTSSEISQMKGIQNTSASKLLVCYMSIGEAESYRDYWNATWDANKDGNPDSSAPSWLDIENPDWEGNYKVKYWMTEWQNIIFGSNSSYLDKIIAQGFDGVYLDIIDGFEYYEDKGDTSAGQKMVDFVGNLSQYAKNKSQNFLIIPQNGESLETYPNYLDSIDGIGREDVLYNGILKNSQDELNLADNHLSKFIEAKKFVLEVEYTKGNNPISDCYDHAKENGYLCYVGPRDLNIIQNNEGFEAD
jgi:cysteinyl-tRNA synthetase, unknown class